MDRPTRAHVEFDPARLGVRLAVARPQAVLTWTDPVPEYVDPEGGQFRTTDETWLHLNEEDARAIYEALADYFGHNGHDARALRKDYEAERARVDRLIAYATAPPVVVDGRG